MSPLRDILERLRAIVSRDRLDRELDEELRFHVDRETAERARQGSTDPERDARLALGGVTQVREATREARGIRSFDELIADIRYALRALRRNPGFTLTVVLVLGIAIAAATTVYRVADRVLFADLPYEEPRELVRIFQRYTATNLGTISVADFQGIAAQQQTLEAVGALRLAGMTLTGTGAAEQIGVGRVTSGVFDALRVRPAHGRALLPRDDALGAPPVVVVSHALAERVLGGAAVAVGRAITLDGLSHEVVGVLGPEHVRLAGVRADAWPAMQLTPPERRGPFGYRGIARLRDGVTIADATADLARISEALFPVWKAGFQDSLARLTPLPLRDTIVGNAGSQVGLFAGAVVLILLLAIANVATLMLVRASAREHELAVRAALGAGRYRLARLVVTECVVLTLVAGAGGAALAGVSLKAVPFLAPTFVRFDISALGGGALLFAAALSVVAGLLVSLGPLSVVLGRKATTSGLGGSGARSGTGRRTNAWRGALVTAEFALALPLLLGAGLLANSFLRLQRIDPGFDPAGVVALSVNLPTSRYSPADAVAFWRRLEDRAAATDGIVAAGYSGGLPPDTQGNVNNFDLLDRPVPAGTAQHLAPWATATRGYFDALGVPLLDGRHFTPGDTAGAPPVAIVSRAWAAKYYPGESAVGRQLYSGGCITCPPTTVVGIVGDVHYRGIDGETDAVYTPFDAAGESGTNLVVRSRGAVAPTLRALREIVATLDPELAPLEIDLAAQFATELADPRRWTTMVGGFAVIGLALAALGIFGLTSFMVRQRRRELGVRLALGAPPRAVALLVVRSGMRFAAFGTAAGLVLSAFESRWLGSLLYEVQALDPATLLVAAATLLLIALAAAVVPAVGAARIPPLEAINSE